MSDEQTILGIANVTRKLLCELEGSLDVSLRRGMSKEQDSAIRERNPSVVGEIIELMHENNKMLASLSEQIRLEVLIKLDRPDNPKS